MQGAARPPRRFGGTPPVGEDAVPLYSSFLNHSCIFLLETESRHPGGMLQRPCRFCQCLFRLSRFHPKQTVCAAAECQRRRRREYHRHHVAAVRFTARSAMTAPEVAGRESRLLGAVPPNASRYHRPEPDSSANQGPKTPRARSCKQQLGSGLKVLRGRGLAVRPRRRPSCKQHLGYHASIYRGRAYPTATESCKQQRAGFGAGFVRQQNQPLATFPLKILKRCLSPCRRFPVKRCGSWRVSRETLEVGWEGD
jgi:hypothetical protein